MNFEEWEPVYEAILADFGYDRAGDEAARDDLVPLVALFDFSRLALAGESVAIAAPGPSLESELDRVRESDRVFAVSSAAAELVEAGIEVDCIVTDLDGRPETAKDLSREGVPVALHAHGDNRDLVRAWVPEFERRNVLGTTQAAPRGPVRNVGGFTDGDRAAFLADHLGAARLSFPGWDLDDPAVSGEKRRKLDWAERLLYWLERRRDDRFGLLDGRREDIEDVPSDR